MGDRSDKWRAVATGFIWAGVSAAAYCGISEAVLGGFLATLVIWMN